MSMCCFHILFFCGFSVNIVSYDRAFLALVERQEDRGTVVAQGGGKVERCDKYLTSAWTLN